MESEGKRGSFLSFKHNRNKEEPKDQIKLKEESQFNLFFLLVTTGIRLTVPPIISL